MNKLLFSFLAVFVACCIGCGYKPDEPSGPGKTIPAKAGSTYTFKNTPIDTTGVELTDSSYMTMDSVVETGITYTGKTNVTHLVTTDLRTGLKTDKYINYEANGDISFSVGGGLGAAFGLPFPDWNTYTVQSHTTTSVQLFDTTIDLTALGLPAPLHISGSDTLSYVNTGSVPVSSKSLPVFNMKLLGVFKGDMTIFVVIPVFATTSVTTLSFAPEIGYYAKQRTEPIKNLPLGFPAVQGSNVLLISYQLR